VGELHEWVHLDAIQALVHHATAVVTAIFLFAVTARLITYLIPDGYAKKIVIIIDDVILLAVFALAGYRLLNYMWVRPQMESTPEEMAEVSQAASSAPDHKRAASDTSAALAQCRAVGKTSEGLRQCLEEKSARAQKALEQASAKMLTDMKALDKVGSAKIGARKSFEAAQQAFLQYREAECRWLGTTAAGAGAEEVYQACMADLASARAARILAFLK
jgi:uncharacterized protein YecT (DUF1311 family)